MKRVRVGLYLGLGPIAGAHFYELFEETFMGNSDYDHPTVICYSSPSIRPAGLGDREISPAIVEGLEFFRLNEVDFILAPCNTLMFYLPTMIEISGLPIVDIVLETVRETIRNYPEARRIGLLSTEETAKWRLYQDALLQCCSECELVLPSLVNREKITQVIAAVKRGEHINRAEPREITEEIVFEMKNEGLDVIIAGCTELSCLLTPDFLDRWQVVDSARVLAKVGHGKVIEST